MAGSEESEKIEQQYGIKIHRFEHEPIKACPEELLSKYVTPGHHRFVCYWEPSTEHVDRIPVWGGIIIDPEPFSETEQSKGYARLCEKCGYEPSRTWGGILKVSKDGIIGEASYGFSENRQPLYAEDKEASFFKAFEIARNISKFTSIGILQVPR